MDFDSLPRRDLQFFCKRNKIPANMTNIAMADALKALEIVEGIEEFANRPDLSPTSVAKNMPSGARTAARTTRKKATKDETQASELVTRSCLVTSKSLAGEMDQENTNANVLQNRRGAAATSVAINLEATATATATPVARSTRKPQVAASSNKEESVQRVYSTRRSVRLLEESMADLSLKSTVAPKKIDAEKEDSSQDSKLQGKSDDNNCGNTEEAEVISVRDLSDSLDKEWDGSKNDPDLDVLYGDLGGITFSDANTTTEQMSGIESNTVSASDSFVLVEGQESHEDDFVVVDHAAASTTTDIVACSKLSEETDPCEDDVSGVVVDTNQEAFGSQVAATDKVDCVPTVVVADDASEESELEVEEMDESEESEPEEEEMSESDEVAPMSDKKKTQDSSSSSEKEAEPESEDEWSDFEISSDIDVKLDLVSLADINNKNEEETVLNNNGEIKAEAEPKKTKKKKTVDEERLKETSMRQLTKMLKEQLAIKSKQQQDKCAE